MAYMNLYIGGVLDIFSKKVNKSKVFYVICVQTVWVI